MISLDVEPGVSGYMNLTVAQRNTIQVAERIGASLSLVGVVFVIVTYALFKKVRNVSNTFIFYASVANVGASIACLIGYDGIEKGDDSALCQAQAFLLEMFMQSDPWWSLSMAINVFMVFFLHFNADVLMKYMWIYNVISFGMPAIPAILCLFVRPDGITMYGNATLWCWISDSHNSVRIYSYYLPIWACIFITTAIYLAIGYQVFHGRNQLRDLTMSTQVQEVTTTFEVRDSAEKSPAGGQTGTTTTATYGTVTTEVQVTRSPECSESTTMTTTTPPSAPLAAPMTTVGVTMAPQILRPGQNPHTSAGSGPSGGGSQIYPWTSPTSSNDDCLTITSPASPNSIPATLSTTTTVTPAPMAFTTISSVSSTVRPLRPANKSPSHPNAASPRDTATPSSSTSQARLNSFLGPLRKLRHMLNSLDPIKLAYLRTSFIFAVSVLVTWTPSSINRVYTLMNPSKTNFGLNLASAIVLPLQGVWNVVIYVLTTWEGLNEEFYRTCGWAPGCKARRRRRAENQGLSDGKFPGGYGNNGGHMQGIRPGVGDFHAAGGIDWMDSYRRHHHDHRNGYMGGPHSRHHHDLSLSTADGESMLDNTHDGTGERLSLGPIGINTHGISRRDHHHEFGMGMGMDFEDDDELPINPNRNGSASGSGSSHAHYQLPPSPRYQTNAPLDGASLSSAGGGSGGNTTRDSREFQRDRTSWKKKGTVRILRNGSL